MPSSRLSGQRRKRFRLLPELRGHRQGRREAKRWVFCIDRPPALYFLNKLGIEGEFPIFRLDTPGGEFHRAVPKGRADLLARRSGGLRCDTPLSLCGDKPEVVRAPASYRPPISRLGIVMAAHRPPASALLLFRRRRLLSGGASPTATAQLRQKLEELEASQAKNRAFIAALPDLFFTLDREGRIPRVRRRLHGSAHRLAR